MVRLARVEPVLKLVGISSVSPVGAQGERGQITVLGHLLLQLSHVELLLQQLQFVEVGVQSRQLGVVHLIYNLFLHNYILLRRIVHHVFQHVILL